MDFVSISARMLDVPLEEQGGLAAPSYDIPPATGGRRRGRGRRPMAEVREDVLKAAAEILLRDGMAAFTIERVAAEAGVSKTTIYKWWPSKGALAFDGYFHATESKLEFPDTGDIAADLRTQLHAFVRLVAATPAGRVVSELVGHAQTDPDLAKAMRASYTSPRRRLAVEALKRAQQRGQIHPDVDPEAVVDQLWGACYHRLLLTGLPITKRFADKLLSNLLLGIQPPKYGEAPQATPSTHRPSKPRRRSR
jgi:AcrR family transcriptional regulator